MASAEKRLNAGLPYHIEAEQCVLGATLIDPVFAIPHTLGYLSDEDFLVNNHKLIFNAMKRIHRRNEPLDVILLGKELDEIPEIVSYLIQLAEFTPSAANVKYYARILKNETARRKKITQAESDITDAIENGVVLGKGFVRLADVLENVLEEAYATTSEGRLSGYATGFGYLDTLLGGLKKGEMYIIAGRPSQGKSTLCSQIANFIYHAGGRVAFFPLEAGVKAQARNITATDTAVEAWKLRKGKGGFQTPDEQDRVLEFLKIQRQGIFNMATNRTAAGMESALRDMIAEHGGIDIIFVDHLQETKPDKNTFNSKRNYEVENTLQELRRIARELDVPLVLAAQVGRASEGREPTLADLKDSGAIEQVADVVMFIHGDERGSGRRTVIVAKNRNGMTGRANFNLFGEILKLEELG